MSNAGRHLASTLRRLATALGVIAFAGGGSSLAAQATVPGSREIEPTRIRFGTVEYRVTLVRGDEEESYGIMRDEIMPIRGNDPMLSRVLTLTQASSVLIDSTLSDLETLAPRWHRSVQPSRGFEFKVDGTRVRGSASTRGAADKAIDLTLKDLAFDSSNWDLIVRALPLAQGESAVLSVFDVQDSLLRYTVTVVDRQARGRADIIHVKLEVAKGREVHAWFDDATRVLLRVETQIGPDTILRQVLKGQ